MAPTFCVCVAMQNFPALLLSMLTASLLVGCGGGSGSTSSAAVTTPTAPNPTAPTPITPTPVVENPACPNASKGSATGVAVAPATPISQLALDKRAAALATAIGTPSRLLVGLGTVSLSSIQAQSIKIDIYDQYLNGVGGSAWPTWNSPSGAYVQIVASNADCLGAVPMFTLYQMATNGDGNLSGLNSTSFMTQYWTNVRLLFTQLKAYGKPALVNFEPDFWGYVQRVNSDPTKVLALVSQESGGDCTGLSNDITGVAGCLIQMARKYAPNAYVGFPPSTFSDLAATETAYMKRIGVDKADFTTMQTLDRDIGCIESGYAAANCNRVGDAKIWDENNLVSPNFKDHFAYARGYFSAIGLPLIWWQTPLGVPSATPGGTVNAFRDNRARYFLTHAPELVAAGGLGVVFSPGHSSQTTINSDKGQFKTLSTSYLASPAKLP